MQLVSYPSAGTFLAAAEGFLLAGEAEYNLQLGLLARIARGDFESFYLATVHDDSNAVVGVVLRTLPHKLLLTRMPVQAMPIVTQALWQRWPDLCGVHAPAEQARAFAEHWPRQGEEGTAQGIYELRAVTPPKAVPGALRDARADDVDRLVEFREGFARDVGPRHVTGDHREKIEGHVKAKRVVVWADAQDVPVSMAGIVRETPNGSCVSLVYTPPQLRGRGYASATVAGLSQRCLDRGKSLCFLFTDLSNPTSNAIYQRLGYTKIAEATEVLFDPPSA